MIFPKNNYRIFSAALVIRFALIFERKLIPI